MRHFKNFLSLPLCGVVFFFSFRIRSWACGCRPSGRCGAEGSSQESRFHDLFGWGALLTHNRHLCAYKYAGAQTHPCCTYTHTHTHVYSTMQTCYACKTTTIYMYMRGNQGRRKCIRKRHESQLQRQTHTRNTRTHDTLRHAQHLFWVYPSLMTG